MKRASDTQILPIFGQLEEVAAKIMAGEDEVVLIPVKDFPPEAPHVNAAGQKALCGMIIATRRMRKFNRLVAELRA